MSYFNRCVLISIDRYHNKMDVKKLKPCMKMWEKEANEKDKNLFIQYSDPEKQTSYGSHFFLI